MPAMVDITGWRFGRLIALGTTAQRSNGKVVWHCRCDCGRLTEVRGTDLRNGRVHSCTCLRDEVLVARSTRHGRARRGAKHPLYAVWRNILGRCLDPHNVAYHCYGGRGITVCERWQGPDGFPNFLADVGPRPTPAHQLDRIDNDQGYRPGNVQWLTPPEHARKHKVRNRHPRKAVMV